MNRVILIKYGELTTKKGNRKFFVQTLYENIKKKLKGLNVKVSKDISRMYIEFDEKDLDLILGKIREVFGIHNFQVATKVESNIDSIKDACLNLMKGENFKTFKVETKRSDKNFPIPSLDFSNQMGGHILRNIDGISVDVHHPDVLLHIEILPHYTYVYTNQYAGLGGYPVGCQKRALLMLSGGIDSPVAGFLGLKRGIDVDCVYFEAIPHTSLEAREKVISLTKKLTKYKAKINLHIVPFTKIQEEIYKNCSDDYTITIMRRMMYRIMEKLCEKHKALAIINGESIGQVASQTLNSMHVINSVTSVPVIRPVACLDKLEIIDIAKKIDTYDISILPFEDCCTVFVPKHPVINPNMESCIKNEAKFDYESLIEETVDNIFTMVITEDMDIVDNDLF